MEEIIQQANLPFEGEQLDAVAPHFVEGVRRELVKNETRAIADSATVFASLVLARVSLSDMN